MKNLQSQKIRIDDTEIDYSFKVPITEILRLLNIVIFNHSIAMGMEHEELKRKSNAFWVITREKLLIKKPVHSGDEVEVKTWTLEPGIVRFERNCSLSVGGEIAVDMMSEWCCLDYETLRPRRSSSIAYPQDLEIAETRQIDSTWTNPKEVFTQGDYVFTRKIRSTDIDVNIHTNNLKYSFITFDALSVDELKGMDIKEYEIYFVNQSHEGDEIDIYKKRVDNCIYIEGKIKDTTIFKSVIKF